MVKVKIWSADSLLFIQLKPAFDGIDWFLDKHFRKNNFRMIWWSCYVHALSGFKLKLLILIAIQLIKKIIERNWRLSLHNKVNKNVEKYFSFDKIIFEKCEERKKFEERNCKLQFATLLFYNSNLMKLSNID